jgi:hypothetical protein
MEITYSNGNVGSTDRADLIGENIKKISINGKVSVTMKDCVIGELIMRRWDESIVDFDNVTVDKLLVMQGDFYDSKFIYRNNTPPLSTICQLMKCFASVEVSEDISKMYKSATSLHIRKYVKQTHIVSKAATIDYNGELPTISADYVKIAQTAVRVFLETPSNLKCKLITVTAIVAVIETVDFAGSCLDECWVNCEGSLQISNLCVPSLTICADNLEINENTFTNCKIKKLIIRASNLVVNKLAIPTELSCNRVTINCKKINRLTGYANYVYGKNIAANNINMVIGSPHVPNLFKNSGSKNIKISKYVGIMD